MSAQRPELLVFVEGLRTEELYLTYWRRRYRDRVLVTIDSFRGGPLQLVQHAVEAQRLDAREEKRGHGRRHSQIWCVFDVDEHPHLLEAVALARRHNILIAVSNPCLELWFVLHFEDRTGYIDRWAVQGRAEALLKCGKVLNEASLLALAERHPGAVKRAIQLDEKHSGDGSPPGSNPSTGIWRLVDFIRGEN